MKEVLRMCLACRQHKDKSVMRRIVKTPENNICVDASGKMNGRGAYVCSTECLEKCKKARLLNRAFKREIDPELYDRLKQEFNKG